MKQIIHPFALVIAVLFGVRVVAQSPITLGNANMPGNGDTLRYTNVQPWLLPDYTQSGPNHTWDFSGLSSAGEGLRSFKSALLTPYVFFFLSTNAYGEKIADVLGAGPLTFTDYYNFYKKTSSPNAFIADGAGITFSSLPVPSYYSDKDELYNFPMSYPKYDSSTFRFSTPGISQIPVRYSKTGYRVTLVDGWGSITTPYGTENCLRLVTTQYSTDSVLINNLGPFSFPLGYPNYQRSFQWLSLNSKIPYLEITGNLIGETFVPVQVRYRGYSLLATGIEPATTDVSALRLYPNPVQDRLYVRNSSQGSLQLELYDGQGRAVLSREAGQAGAGSFVDVSGLEPGLYIVKTIAKEGVSSFKFIKN